MNNTKRKEHQTNQPGSVAAFVVSLLAGLWMLASAAMGGMGWLGGMGHGPMMGATGRADMPMWMWRHGFVPESIAAGAWSWLGLALAILVCSAAVLLYVRPRSPSTWGVVILIGSMTAALTGVGFLPAALGVTGGVLAILARPAA